MKANPIWIITALTAWVIMLIGFTALLWEPYALITESYGETYIPTTYVITWPYTGWLATIAATACLILLLMVARVARRLLTRRPLTPPQ
jgi:hypothetical protein